MKRRKLAIILIIALTAGIAAGIFAYGFHRYRRKEGLRFAASLGNGINLGNSLDVYKVRDRKPEADIAYFETYWNNPRMESRLFQGLSEEGTKLCRIPVSWGEHMDDEGNVDPLWMERVRQVVDYALSEDMRVILDTHHESWLIPDEDAEGLVTRRFGRLWEQIAGEFSDVDERLLFEGMNEARLIGTKDEWTAGCPKAWEAVNRLNEEFVKRVRGAGGFNEKRWLLISAYGTSGKREALENLELPGDRRIIVAVHAYYPHDFAMNEDGTARWSADDEADTRQIDELMEDLEEIFLENDTPVIITEFGCRDKHNTGERLLWLDYYLEKANSLGIPCIWWDDGASFKIIDRETGEATAGPLVERLYR